MREVTQLPLRTQLARRGTNCCMRLQLLDGAVKCFGLVGNI